MRTPHWNKVLLIFRREVRDQFRDRRTLFTVVILPLLLYPMLGIGMLQVAQFLKKHPSRVLLVTDGKMPNDPPLLVDGHFAGLTAAEDALFDIDFRELELPAHRQARRQASSLVDGGQYDLVAVFSRDFCEFVQRRATEVSAAREALPSGSRATPESGEGEVASGTLPQPELFYNSAKDRSRVAYQRVSDVLLAWRQRLEVPQSEIQAAPKPAATLFELQMHDLAQDQHRKAAIWSKILPFIVFVWALTGAFYPAIDLCAGEKERGTLETLLSSAAERLDIVWGKLLTTMLFAGATAILNMICMLGTANFITRQFAALAFQEGLPVLGAPPLASLFWVLLALLPITALFSSLALALASMARSAKEGQYYLMPLIMGFTPLMMLAMLPSAQLDLGTSLLPVTGLMLLLRHVMEGEIDQVWLFAIPVFGVTIGCCHLAVRWAVNQFSNEDVLFRPGERFSVSKWIRHLLRDRAATPSVSEAILCGLIILFVRFFVGATAGMPQDWNGFVQFTTVSLIAFVVAPPLLMTVMLTTSFRETLLLKRPAKWSVLAAIGLAVCLHPFAMAVAILVRRVYRWMNASSNHSSN